MFYIAMQILEEGPSGSMS